MCVSSPTLHPEGDVNQEECEEGFCGLYLGYMGWRAVIYKYKHRIKGAEQFGGETMSQSHLIIET